MHDGADQHQPDPIDPMTRVLAELERHGARFNGGPVTADNLVAAVLSLNDQIMKRDVTIEVLAARLATKR